MSLTLALALTLALTLTRLNVMITRARRGLVLFGAAETLEADDDWRAYLRWLRRNKCYVPLGAPNIFAPP